MPITDTPTELPFWKSKIILGSIVALIAFGLTALGVVDVPTDAQADIVDSIVAGGGVIGMLTAIIARVTQVHAPTITAT